MLNRHIEIHDSELANVSIVGGCAELHFSAVCVHQSEGTPGVDAGSSFFQEATLRITDVHFRGSFAEFPVDLGNGETRIEGKQFPNEIPLPLAHQGAFELCLKPMWQEEAVVFIGTGAKLELFGEPRSVEDFPGQKP